MLGAATSIPGFRALSSASSKDQGQTQPQTYRPVLNAHVSDASGEPGECSLAGGKAVWVGRMLHRLCDDRTLVRQGVEDDIVPGATEENERPPFMLSLSPGRRPVLVVNT